jgi:hypothetical protein
MGGNALILLKTVIQGKRMKQAEAVTQWKQRNACLIIISETSSIVYQFTNILFGRERVTSSRMGRYPIFIHKYQKDVTTNSANSIEEVAWLAHCLPPTVHDDIQHLTTLSAIPSRCRPRNQKPSPRPPTTQHDQPTN